MVTEMLVLPPASEREKKKISDNDSYLARCVGWGRTVQETYIHYLIWSSQLPTEKEVVILK